MTEKRWGLVSTAAVSAVLLACGLGAACAQPTETTDASQGTAPSPTQPPGTVPTPSPPASGHPLAGTAWRLVEIQSMDDAVGTTRPDDPSLYTMRLGSDGTVAMRVNCNRANGSWLAESSSDPSNGRFQFGPLAATRALCPRPSLDERIVEQAHFVRGYLLKDGRLYLSLMADGGIFAWEPMSEVTAETSPDAALEAAILQASPSYTKALIDVTGGTGRGRYVYSRVDLNSDGRNEVLVYLLGSMFCGSGGCTVQLFTESQGGYVLINEFPITRTPVIVSAERTDGWSDLFRLESGGGAPASYVRHAFDGRKYVERERTPADKMPDGTRYLTGEVTFDRGIPLEPADAAAPGSGPSAPPPSETGFSTVCGVSVGGQDYPYRCTVEGAAPGASGTTFLHFPDNTVTIGWLGGGKATATFAGMVPKDVGVTTEDGVTRFPFEGKVYFYASDRTVAAAQLAALR